MNAALLFTVPDPVTVAKDRCLQAINHLGAPLKSDSGHFVTGVVTSGHNNVEIRVTWLEETAGTQITVSATHEELSEQELENVTQRFRHEYLHRTSIQRRRSFPVSPPSLFAFAVFLGAVVCYFLFFKKH